MKKLLLLIIVFCASNCHGGTFGDISIYDRFNNYSGRYSKTSQGYNSYNKYNSYNGKFTKTYNGYNVYNRYNTYQGRLDYGRGQKTFGGTSKIGGGYFENR